MTSPYTAVNEVRTTHTPGPWAVGSPYGLLKTEIDAPDSSRAVCTVWTKMSPDDRDRGRQVICDDDPEGHANARLIAAAPDLLAAAREALHFISNIDNAHASVRLLRAAISSAESSP